MSAKRPNASASAKKAAAAAQTPTHYAFGDIVLGKVRGYAPWPGIVVNPESVPETVAADKPGSKKTTFYCVRFFPNNDYAWLVEKDISRLKPHEIESYIAEPAKKKADLLEAYRIAQDPTEWIKAKDRAVAEQAEVDARAEVDQLESDTGGSTKSKKRKRPADESASAKVSTAGKKGKKETTASAKGAKKAASGKGRKNGSKSKEVVESEDEDAAGQNGNSASGAEDNGGPSGGKKASPPPAKKQKKGDGEGEDESKEDPEAVKVRDWRHKLQKTFLGKVPPKAEDMAAVDELFKTVEACEGITIEQLQFSKIGKVMRHIAALPAPKVPLDAELKFRERAKALVERWHAILSASKTPAAAESPVASAPPAATKGRGGKKGSAGASKKEDEGAEEREGEEKANGAVKDLAAAIDAKAEGEVDAEGEKDADADAEVGEGVAKIDLNGKEDGDAAMADASEGAAAGETKAADAGVDGTKDVEMAEA